MTHLVTLKGENPLDVEGQGRVESCISLRVFTSEEKWERGPDLGQVGSPAVPSPLVCISFSWGEWIVLEIIHEGGHRVLCSVSFVIFRDVYLPFRLT